MRPCPSNSFRAEIQIQVRPAAAVGQSSTEELGSNPAESCRRRTVRLDSVPQL